MQRVPVISLIHEESLCDARPPAVSPPLTFTRAAELLDVIRRVDQHGAEMIVAEIGMDIAQFETAPCLATWAGVAPGNDENARTQRSGKTRMGNRLLRAVLIQLAHAMTSTIKWQILRPILAVPSTFFLAVSNHVWRWFHP